MHCPVCGRAVARGAWQCPYCDEPLPGRVRVAMLAALAWPLAPFAAVRALVRNRAARCRTALLCAAVAPVALALVADPVFRTGALRLWTAHGAGLALAAAAASALCRNAPEDAVADATARGRIRDALLRGLPGCVGAAATAALLFALLPARIAAATLAAVALCLQIAGTESGAIPARRSP